ncbi:hypothetical protein [Bacteroides sp.]|uniref:hypothetical protein n=1 Tax=Bacteroides sp. TaxID=29523 RepID=UPI00261B7343|nr:hypothetical protein [Bacteroides sp.]MDD3039065.1 hypothetical protein [Bacteroides sp.]
MIAIKNNAIEYTATKPISKPLIEILTEISETYTHPPEHFIRNWFPFYIDSIERAPNQPFVNEKICDPIISIEELKTKTDSFHITIKLKDPYGNIDDQFYSIVSSSYNNIETTLNSCLI